MDRDEIINEILKLSVDDMEEIKIAVSNEIHGIYDKERKKDAESHKKYVGKCFVAEERPYYDLFPKMKKYYKVISERACNEHNVSALTFFEHPVYWYNYNSKDNYFGNYDLESINIDDLFDARLVFNNLVFNNLTEITPEEYNKAMDNYIAELQSMDFPADHYRFGNKMPSDPGWKTEQK